MMRNLFKMACAALLILPGRALADPGPVCRPLDAAPVRTLVERFNTGHEKILSFRSAGRHYRRPGMPNALTQLETGRPVHGYAILTSGSHAWPLYVMTNGARLGHRFSGAAFAAADTLAQATMTVDPAAKTCTIQDDRLSSPRTFSLR